MRSASDVSQAFLSFDGTHVAPLTALLRGDLSADAEGAVMGAIPGPDEVAATWVVKALAEKGRIGGGRLTDVFEALPRVTEDEAALHILQCARFAPDAAPLLRPHLARFYGAKKMLLRVWAFDAYCRGAPEGEDLSERIRQGLQSRSGAMRARSRALAREFGVDLENDP